VRTLLAHRGDPADHVARRALRHGRLGHHGLLRAQGRGDRLEVELARDRDHPDGEPAVGRDEQGLEDPPRVDAERPGGFQAEGLRGRAWS
jgi:hypothetical protein